MINLNSKTQLPVENGGGKQQHQQQNGFHDKAVSGKKLKKTTNEEGAAAAKPDAVKNQIKGAAPAPAGAVKYDPKMLESFWKLSEYSYETRRDGIRQISDYFGKLDAEANKDAYNYILMRLVRGLASNRKCSRLGFSSALTELLVRYPSLKFEKVLEVADKNLNTPIDAQSQAPSGKKANTEEAILDNLAIMSKEELRHMQIGVVFVYFCWIKSNRLDSFAQDQHPSKQSLKLLDTVVHKLNEMRLSGSKDIKEYIQQLYLNAFVMVVKKLLQINKSLFDEKVLPLIKDELQAFTKSFDESHESGSADASLQLRDTLHILLACLNASTAASSIDVINKAKQLIFKPSNHNQLYDFVSKSSELLPNLHPFCVELVEYGVHGTSLETGGSKQQKKFAEFWLSVIDAKMLQRKEPEKKLLAYKLYLVGLKHLNESNYEQLFTQCFLESTNLQKTLVNNLVLKASNLNELINKSYVKELVEQIKALEAKFKVSSSPLTPGADLVIKLINYGQRNIHDMSELVGSVILELNEKSLAKFSGYLIDEYNNCLAEKSKLLQAAGDKETNGEAGEERNLQLASLQMKKLWIVNQLTNLSKNAALFENADLVNSLVSNLVSNSFFEKLSSAPATKKASKKSKSSAEESTGPERLKLLTNTDNKCILQLRDSLFKYFGLLINKNEHKMNSIIVSSLKQIESLLGQCADEGDERAGRKRADLVALGARMLKLTEKINKLFKKEEEATSKSASHDPEVHANRDVLQTFFMIVSFESLKMFESLRDSKKVIDDLEICFENFYEDYKSEKKASEASKVLVSDEAINPDEVKWIDFLVEMLLNLLPINNSWIRNTVKIQFRKLFPKLTFNSIKLIIDIIEPNSETSLLMEVDEEDDGLSDDNEGDEDEEVDEAAKKVNKIDLGKDKKKKKKAEDNDDGESEEEDAPSKKKKRKRPAKDEDEDDESSSSDDDDDEDDEDDPSAPAHDKELRDALLKALGEAGVADDGDDSGPDLDDETMLKLDETLAEAFRMRKKTKSNQMDVVQIKLRALDLVQELFKTTYRLDLITYSIKPMLDILFESQKKPNLKNISQRILGFLVNLKNTTKKLNDSKFPSLDEIFTLLNHIIKCSTVHFNVTNTLVEASMFCVRLIQHLANTNKSESEKAKTLNRLNEIYLEIIKNFYTSPTPAAAADQNNNNNSNKKATKNASEQPNAESGKINPSMYKEYLLRYPAYSNKLALKMIELASLPDVKLHKKTVTLITLQQTINNQMFNELKQDLIDEFMEKIFIFFNKIIDEIMQDENIHIKFLDAFLSLVAKVLNLKKNFIKEALIENLVKKLTQFVKESKAKQAFKNRCTHLIQTCHGYLKKN